MLKILRTSKESVKDFDEKAWHKEDLHHWGKNIDWKDKKFRFKALSDGKVVGTINGKYESGVLHIGALIVDAGERGKGIGKALMQKAEKFGVDRGAHKISLETGVDWEARNFYESIGYRKTADIPDHYFHHDFVIYSKNLPPKSMS